MSLVDELLHFVFKLIRRSFGAVRRLSIVSSLVVWLWMRMS